jgi:N6-L-threonylcarbamoyladenine synthase
MLVRLGADPSYSAARRKGKGLEMMGGLTVLGIETSCDETAAAVVHGRAPGPGSILSNIIATQFDEHKPFGGVVPEIAARAHVSRIDGVTSAALSGAGVGLADLDAIAVTAGPGLIGGVAAGLMFAKGLALAAGKPLFGVNHLAAHALTARLAARVDFPYLLLLVSGGHCQLVLVRSSVSFERLGTTIDDAAGEAFDKTAKLLGLGYPGGPSIEAAARSGDPSRFHLPRPLLGQAGLDFSFSGLKTAVRRIVEQDAAPRDPQFVCDVAASFQAAIADILVQRSARAMAYVQGQFADIARFVVAGGVAANQSLRSALHAAALAQGFEMSVAPPSLCTDNAAMVAWAGVELFGLRASDGLDMSPRARWPLDARFEDVKGAKA